MTDELNQGVSTPASAESVAPVADAGLNASNASESSIDTSAAIPTATPEVVEKMIPQSQVSKIAAREKREAEQKTEARVRAEYEQRIAQMQQASGGQEGQTFGGVQQNEAQMRQMIQQEAAKMAQYDQANRIAQDYTSKVKAEMINDPEFADLYDDLNIEQHPNLVLMVNSLDNTTAVIKDIAKNPSKFANVLMLANSGNVQLAHKELKRLSDSIKANELAKAQPQAAAPLSQLKPSNAGVGDGTDKSVSDFRKMFRG